MSPGLPPVSSFQHRAARVLATWFGCGLSPVAPGTVGTLGALPLWFLVRGGGAWVILATAVIATLVGVWSASVVARVSGLKDPQIVVIDEVAGVLIALAGAPQTTSGIIGAVVLFRVFDMTKPFPARSAEKLPGGWGIVIDDVVAGVQAALVVRGLALLGVLP